MTYASLCNETYENALGLPAIGCLKNVDYAAACSSR